MKRTSLLSAVLSLFLLVPASITRAQTVSSQKGLTTAIFNVQQGIIKLYLPDDIRPGDIISGSINAEPKGNNAKQLSTNLEALKQYTVSIINNKISVDNNKLFQITVLPGKPLPVQVLLSDAAANKVSAITVGSIPENNTAAGSSECNIPLQALADAPLRINGPFDGNASNTKCSLDGKPTQVIAESPRLCIILFPAVQPGNYTLNCQESGKQPCNGNIGAVDMNVTAGKMNLRKGEKTYIDVKISGLDNLRDTARLSITNVSAGVIAMKGGNNTILSILPSANTNGVYTRRFEAESIQTGTFTVNIDLDLPETKPATQPQPVYNMKVWLPLKGGDLSASYDGQTDEAKVNGGEHVYVIDNAIRVFLNGIFLQEYDLANNGTSTVQQILTEYSDINYAEPGIGCDSLNRICNKNAAFNVFWGDVYSVFEGKATTKLAKGEVIENASQNSLLITRGWEIDCCTGEYRLKLFFQSMAGGGEKGSHNISYSRILRTGNPCPVKCPDCRKKCDDMNKRKEELRKEAAKRMEEAGRKGNN